MKHSLGTTLILFTLTSTHLWAKDIAVSEKKVEKEITHTTAKITIRGTPPKTRVDTFRAEQEQEALYIVDQEAEMMESQEPPFNH